MLNDASFRLSRLCLRLCAENRGFLANEFIWRRPVEPREPMTNVFLPGVDRPLDVLVTLAP